MSALNQFLWGALGLSGWIAGLFFLRFGWLTRDRLFFFFSLAFWLLALNWLGLALTNASTEGRHQVYVLRLLAFVLIIVGIVDKNRRTERQSRTRFGDRSSTPMNGNADRDAPP